MNKHLLARLENLENSTETLPVVYYIDAPFDMPRETAMAMLKIKPRSGDLVICWCVLPPGSKPKLTGDVSPISDARWKKLKNYPREKGWWDHVDWSKRAEAEGQPADGSEHAQQAEAAPPAKTEGKAERARAEQLQLEQEQRDNARQAMWDKVCSFNGE